ncbi:hypothetical protein HFD88_004530 [Aspergillus terreus]|nr:hypothetical protein HFD88_004530 [Aspergillus terreus]
MCPHPTTFRGICPRGQAWHGPLGLNWSSQVVHQDRGRATLTARRHLTGMCREPQTADVTPARASISPSIPREGVVNRLSQGPRGGKGGLTATQLPSAPRSADPTPPADETQARRAPLHPPFLLESRAAFARRGAVQPSVDAGGVTRRLGVDAWTPRELEAILARNRARRALRSQGRWPISLELGWVLGRAVGGVAGYYVACL